jgi:hypothetical protein
MDIRRYEAAECQRLDYIIAGAALWRQTDESASSWKTWSNTRMSWEASPTASLYRTGSFGRCVGVGRQETAKATASPVAGTSATACFCQAIDFI